MCLGAHCGCLVSFPALADDAAASFPAHAIIVSFTTEIINAFVLDCVHTCKQVFLCACMLRLGFRPLFGQRFWSLLASFRLTTVHLGNIIVVGVVVCYSKVIGHKACSEAFLRVDDHVSSETSI